MSDFVRLFRDRVADHGDRDALVFLRSAGSGVTEDIVSYSELDRRARRVAAWLATRTEPGDRAMLLFPPGPEFAAGFLGCLYAGVIAVPAPLPDSGGRGLARLSGIAADAEIRAVLTENAVLEPITAWLTAEALLTAEAKFNTADIACAATDGIEAGAENAWRRPSITSDTIAFLQYTSGSTSEPKGVVVTHANLLHNEAEIQRVVGSSPGEIGLGWLPQFHDMGLIGLLLHPLYVGGTCVFMSPMTFLKRPQLWLSALDSYGATMTVAPNFAFELASRRITDEQIEKLDLSRLRVVLNGSEPVRDKTLRRFAERFAPAGFDAGALAPCYGLAETTLLVTGTRGGHVVTRTVDPDALERNEISDPVDAGRVLVSSGTADGLEVRIVDPDTLVTLPDGRVGEIWVRGGSVAAGYWKQPELTARTFHATTGGETGFLRTGDLGALEDGELYVTGRIKDLLIVNGRNLYPQDIEHTAGQVHPALASGAGAAFLVDFASAGKSTSAGVDERLVLVHEIKAAELAGLPRGELVEELRARIRSEFDVHLTDVVLVARGGVARTTSGKVRRGRMRAKFLSGELRDLFTQERGAA